MKRFLAGEKAEQPDVGTDELKLDHLTDHEGEENKHEVPLSEVTLDVIAERLRDLDLGKNDLELMRRNVKQVTERQSHTSCTPAKFMTAMNEACQQNSVDANIRACEVFRELASRIVAEHLNDIMLQAFARQLLSASALETVEHVCAQAFIPPKWAELIFRRL